jgi:hypothetical protein
LRAPDSHTALELRAGHSGDALFFVPNGFTMHATPATHSSIGADVSHGEHR